MAIFGKKKELTVDELIEALNALSDEDKKTVLAKTTGEQVGEAKEDVEDKGDDSQSDKDRIDESVGEQEHLDGDEDSQDAKDRVDESKGEEKTLDDKGEDGKPEDHEDVQDEQNLREMCEALAARLTAMDEKVADLTERLANVVDGMDNKAFGAHPQVEDGGKAELSTDEQVMRSYNRAYRG